MSAEPSPTAPAPIDPEALLCALVLTPTGWSRNRFFALFQQPVYQQARRRASIVRGLLRQVRKYPGGSLRFVPRGDGTVMLHFEVEALGYRRSSVLSPLEQALVQYALGRAEGVASPPEARTAVESALAKMVI